MMFRLAMNNILRSLDSRCLSSGIGVLLYGRAIVRSLRTALLFLHHFLECGFHRSVTLAINTTKMTMRALKNAITKYLNHCEQINRAAPWTGKKARIAPNGVSSR